MKKISVLLLTILTLITPSPVQGQTVSLSIWPARLEVVIQPGKAITQAYQLKNLGDDVTIQATIVPFAPTGVSGYIQLTPKAESPIIDYFSFQNIDLPATFPLKSGQTQELILTIRVPETAALNDHYLTLLLTADAQGLFTGSGTRALGTIGSNILLTISNPEALNPTVHIEKFSVKKILDSFEPINWEILVKNSSSHWLKAIGQVEIKNAFGNLRATLPLREDNVLAGSSRQLVLVNNWQPVLPLGKFKAQVTITPQNSTNTISQTITFFCFPYKAALLLILISLLYIIIKRHQKASIVVS